MLAFRIHYLGMNKLQKPTPKKTLSFRASEEIHKFLADEEKAGKKDKSRFLEGLLWLGVAAYKRTRKDIIL